MHFFAKWISRLGHPILVYPLSMLVLFSTEHAWKSLLIVSCFSFGLPFLFFLYLFFSKKISDFDIMHREQRYSLYGVALLGMLTSMAFLYFNEPGFLFSEFLRLFLLATALVIINFKIKVSIHVLMITILAILLIHFYGLSSWILLLTPLMGCSRILLKRHSWLEVALGALLPFIALYVF